MHRFFLLLALNIFLQGLDAQVRLVNASFEGDAQDASMPINWFPCEPGSTPDILPGPWGVYTEASEGETFMGLISREDGTIESVGQRLAKPLDKGECYSLKVDLAHSPSYSSYNRPIQLRIWGCRTKCGKDQLLGESKVIDQEDWETYEFKFGTKTEINYIILEAYYLPSSTEPGRKGNILIDNLSEIRPCRRA